MTRCTLSRSVSKLWWETCKALMPTRRTLPDAEIAARHKILKNDSICVYCGDEAGTMDHFRPVIETNGMPSGYCDDDWNIVPACLSCNSSKGNRHWLTFMLSSTPKSPTTRNIPYLARKITKLRKFEHAGKQLVQTWDVKKYRKKLEAMKTSLKGMASVHADRLRALLTVRPAANRLKGTTSKPQRRKIK